MIVYRTTVWALLGVAVLAGCNNRRAYETIPTIPTSGTITVNGVPAKGAIVRLYPKTKQAGVNSPLAPSGRADASGKFQLTTYSGPDGAPPGDYLVSIEWPDPAWRPPGGGMAPPPPDRLKGRFSNPQRSKIEVTIQEGDNEIEPIVLEEVAILKGSSLQ
ncbi:carboxypeptidase regulatory-like domain-containing protein [Blastopirellula marina]|nr:carboxypeptidase regulatory-like domain-containing protein [Blastopirellula marina]